MKRVLFVCTGNTCRSPMAAAILTHLSKNKPFPLEVKSAGLYAVPEEEISPQAKEVLISYGIDSFHSSKRLDRSLLEWANIVLTMTEHHKQSILAEFHPVQEKVYTLTEYIADDPLDIVDPYGAPVDVYHLCAEELYRYMEKLIEKWSKE